MPRIGLNVICVFVISVSKLFEHFYYTKRNYILAVILMQYYFASAEKTTTKRPEYENPGDLHYRRTTERYPENTKKPNVYVDDYDGSNKKTTVRVERYDLEKCLKK